jgi:hypothetical protein
MNSDLASERRVSEGSGIIHPPARRVDKPHANSPSLARVDSDVCRTKPATVAAPDPTITRDTQIADVIVNSRGERPERSAESWAHSDSITR